ncbi:hypothetical protein H4R34_003748 [Dimargaris verticillata]|uniref:Uncharacterized protein n=1 Tax=Dimargaris verticillata TaxID=2761393 RepID=A0A9W8EBR3_9FUNG|nr:hypothetical protein H4R34_003748 [Dimargaris verticillata]
MDPPCFAPQRCSLGSFGAAPTRASNVWFEHLQETDSMLCDSMAPTIDSRAASPSEFSLPPEFGEHRITDETDSRSSWDTLDRGTLHSDTSFFGPWAAQRPPKASCGGLHGRPSTPRVSDQTLRGSLSASDHHQQFSTQEHSGSDTKPWSLTKAASCMPDFTPGPEHNPGLDGPQRYFQGKSYLPWAELAPKPPSQDSDASMAWTASRRPSLNTAPSFTAPSAMPPPSTNAPMQPPPSTRQQTRQPRLTRSHGPHSSKLFALHSTSYLTMSGILPTLRPSKSLPRIPLHRGPSVSRQASVDSRLRPSTAQGGALELPRSTTTSQGTGTTSVRSTGLIKVMPNCVTLNRRRPLRRDLATGAWFYQVEATMVNLSRYPMRLQLVPQFDATVVSVANAHLSPGGLADLSFVIAVDTRLLSAPASPKRTFEVQVTAQGQPQSSLHLRFY